MPEVVGEGRAKAVVEEGDKDMGIAWIVEESIWGKERERVRVAKKERKKVMVEGEGERVEEGGGEAEDGVGEGGEEETFQLIFLGWLNNK